MVRCLALVFLCALAVPATANVLSIKQLVDLVHSNHVPSYERLVQHVNRAVGTPLEAFRLQFPAMGVMRIRSSQPKSTKESHFYEDKIIFTAESVRSAKVRFANKLKQEPDTKKASKQEGSNEDGQEDTKKEDKKEDKEDKKKGDNAPVTSNNNPNKQEQAAHNEASNQYQQCMAGFEKIQEDPECVAIMHELKDMETTDTKALDKMCNSNCWEKVQKEAAKAGQCLDAINSPGEQGKREKAAARMLEQTVHVVCSKNDQQYCVTYFGELMSATEMKCSMWDEMGCCATEVVSIAVLMSDMAGADINQKDVVTAMKQKCPTFPDPLPAPCAACGLAPTMLVLLLSLVTWFNSQ